MKNLSARLSLASILVVVLSAAAKAQTGAADSAVLFQQCDGDTAARIRFIEDNLEDDRTYARYYYGGWLGFYTVGIGYSSFEAAHNERGEQAVHIASAVKAVGGIGRMLYWPPNAKEGADASRGLPANSAAQCRQRLEVAEQTLRLNAEQADRRWDWKQHVINLAIHVTGAVIIGEVYNGARQEAWQSAGIATVVGEAIIWTFPWQAKGVLEEYERRFPATGLPPEPRVGWGIAPTIGGASVYVRF
jgi:hypothetical protein